MLLDYGRCPDRPCENGGRCAKRGSSPYDFFCVCPDGYTGRYCEMPIIDLFPLIILPIFLALLLLPLLIICCSLLRRPGPTQVRRSMSAL